MAFGYIRLYFLILSSFHPLHFAFLKLKQLSQYQEVALTHTSLRHCSLTACIPKVPIIGQRFQDLAFRVLALSSTSSLETKKYITELLVCDSAQEKKFSADWITAFPCLIAISALRLTFISSN